MGHTFRADSSSALVNLISFRPCFRHPPAGTNGTTLCGVGNAMWPGPGVAPGAALPRVKAKDINNPNGVVPMVRMGGM